MTLAKLPVSFQLLTISSRIQILGLDDRIQGCNHALKVLDQLFVVQILGSDVIQLSVMGISLL